jgi:hypothetical protein
MFRCVRTSTPATKLRFRADAFEELLRERGLDAPGDPQKAKLLGVTRPHYWRVVRGDTAPGAAFIKGALTALPGVEFSELFEEVAAS